MQPHDTPESDDALARALIDDLAAEPVPDLAPAVMQRVAGMAQARRARGMEPEPARDARATPPSAPTPRHAAHPPAARRAAAAARWLVRPRRIAFTLRPALLAALVAAFMLGIHVARSGDAVGPGVAPPQAGYVFVQFRLDVAGARDVRLAGDFTDWQPAHALREVAPGVWTTVVPLRPGLHEYAFVIDGERWAADPLADQVEDGFGGVNSRVAVLMPERAESL